MKSFLEKSKRALVLLLTGAMIATSVPADVFAAPLEPDEDVIFEEGADAVEALGVADEEPVVEEAVDPVDPDEAKAEVVVTLSNHTGVQDSATNVLHAEIYDYDDVWASTALNGVKATSADVNRYVDPDKDYVLIVNPDEGLAFNEDKPLTVTGSYKDYSTNTNFGESKSVTATVTDLTPEEAGYYNRGAKKVTVSSEDLTAVLTGMHATDPSKPDDGILTLKFANPATAAKWKVSGFDLKDIEEKEHLSSLMNVTNNADYELDLSEVLSVGALNEAAFGVRVLVFNKDDVLVMDSGDLGTTAMDLTTSHTFPDDMKRVSGATTTGTKIWANYNESGHLGNLQIDGDAITYFYNNNYKLIVDVTANGLGTVKVKTTAASEALATFTACTGGDLDATNEVSDVVNSSTGASFDTSVKNKAFVFFVEKRAPYAYIQSVTWTVAGVTNKAEFQAKKDKWKVSIPNSDLQKGDITVEVKGGYSVSNFGSSSEYRVVDLDGKLIEQTGTESDLVFQCVPGNGKVVSGVTYTVGGGDPEAAELNTTDGTYTIKKEKITGNIQIIADTASSGTSGVKIVKLAGTYTGVTVKRLDAGNTTISASGTSVNTNDPLLFTVTSSTQKIEEVSYSMGSTTFTKLDPVYGSTYKIAAITAATTIKIVYQPQVEVFAPSNKNVTVNFAAVGKSAKVPAGAFTFTVAPVSENIKITKVSYNTTNALAATVGTELGKTGDTFNVTAGNTYYIVVETEETVDNTTYKAIFSDTTTPALITTSYAEGKAKTELNITEQELKLVIGDAKQTIVPAYKPIKSEKLRSALTGGTYTMTAPETTDILTFDNAVNQVKITPKKVGNQDVVVSYKKADGDYGNVLVYPGTLKVSVAQAYTDLEIKASMDTAYTYDESTARADLLDHIKLEFRGKDGQTGVYGPVSVSTSKGVKSLEWSFVPTIDTVKPADRKHAFFSAAPNNGETLAAVGTNGNSTNTAYVLAKEAESVTVKANIIFTDGSEQSLTKTLTFINPITETYFMTRTIDGAIHSFDKFTSASSPTAYDNSNPVILGLNTIDKKDLTVKYDYYRVIDTTGTYNTEAQIKKALTDGKIVKVDNAVIGTASVANMTVENTVNVIDKNSYATIETVDGGYKVTATGVITGKNTNHIKLVAPDVTINGVKIPSLNYANRSVTVWIANEIDRYNVELVTVDDQSKDAGGNLVNLVQTLSDAYIAGREFSKVTRDINSDHVKEQTGYEFTEVGDDSSFKLPEESDFATKPYSKKILLGWAETTYSPSAEGAIKATASLADSVLAPGTYVTITKDTAYKAIWADKYVKYTGTTATKDVAASSLGALVKLYDATKAYVDSTGKTVYPTLATTLEVGYDIPVVAGVAKVKGIKSGSNGKVYHTTNGVVVAELDVEEEFYTEGFTIAAKDENAQQIFDTNGLEAGHIKAKTTLPGTGVITAEVTDAGRTDITDKYSADSTVALTAATTASLAWTADSGMTTFPASPKITEGGAPATVTAALTDNGNAITLIAENGVESTTNKRYYNYSFVWTSSKPEIATVKAGNKTKQNVVTINPLAAGKTTITATVSKSGKEIATKNFELEVLASDITLEFADSEGHTGITEAIAHAGQKSTGVFKVKAVSKSGKNVSGGVFTFGSSYTGNKVIDGGQAALSSANPGDGFTGDANGYLNVPVITRDFVGTDTLHVQFAYTESGVTTTYQKDINIKTYYSVTLKPAPSTWITKNGTKQVGADGKTAVPVEIKLFEEDMKDVVDTAYSKADATRKKDFNFKAISLEGYSAIYND